MFACVAPEQAILVLHPDLAEEDISDPGQGYMFGNFLLGEGGGPWGGGGGGGAWGFGPDSQKLNI